MYLKFVSFFNAVKRGFAIIANPVASLTLRAAIIQADARYLITGNRQFVLPSKMRHKLLVTDYIREIHSQGLAETRRYGRHVRINRSGALKDQAFYWTRSRKTVTSDRRPMSRPARQFRRQMFYSWWNKKK